MFTRGSGSVLRAVRAIVCITTNAVLMATVRCAQARLQVGAPDAYCYKGWMSRQAPIHVAAPIGLPADIQNIGRIMHNIISSYRVI